MTKFSDAQAIYSEVEIEAEDWNTLCWYGSLWSHADDVMVACERAVELAPNDGVSSDGLPNENSANSQRREIIMNRSSWITTLLLMAFFGWFGINLIGPNSDDTPDTATPEQTESAASTEEQSAGNESAEDNEDNGSDVKATSILTETTTMQLCREAQNLFDKEKYEDALIADVTLLKYDQHLKCSHYRIDDTLNKLKDEFNDKLCECDVENSSKTCSIRDTYINLGLERTAETQCKPAFDQYEDEYFLARILVDLGHKEAASEELKEKIKQKLEEDSVIDANIKSSKDLLTILEDPFEEVRILAELGQDREIDEAKRKLIVDAAEQKLDQILIDNPRVDVPHELNYLLDEFGEAAQLFKYGLYWASLKRFWQELTLRSFFALIIGLVIFLVVVNRFSPVVKSLFVEQLDIGDFEGKLESETSETVKRVATLIEESAIQLCTRADYPLPDMVLAPMDLKLGKELLTSSQKSTTLEILFEFIDWALPKSLIILTGDFHPSGDQGVGLTLRLFKKQTNQILAEYTIWQTDFGCKSASQQNKNIDSYYQLVKPAAVWVIYKFNEHKQTSALSRLRLRLKNIPIICHVGLEEFKILGTKDWRSYAHFQVGVDWRLAGKKHKARESFVKALDRDPENLGALFNLAILDIEQAASEMGDRDDYKWVVRRLKRIQKLAKDKSCTGQQQKLLWHKATYQLAATYLYMSRNSHKFQYTLDEAKKLIDGSNEATSSKQESNVCRVFLEEAKWQAEQEEFCNSIDKSFKVINDLVFVMHASILAELGMVSDAQTKITLFKEKYGAQLSYRVHYNLACYYSRVGKLKEEEATRLRRDTTEKLRSHIILSFRFGQNLWSANTRFLLRRNDKHKKVSCLKLVAEEEKKKQEARENYKNAIDHLKRAFERGGNIVEWAKIDPGLSGVRKSKLSLSDTDEKSFEQKFKELTSQEEQKEKTPNGKSRTADLAPPEGLRCVTFAVKKG